MTPNDTTNTSNPDGAQQDAGPDAGQVTGEATGQTQAQQGGETQQPDGEGSDPDAAPALNVTAPTEPRGTRPPDVQLVKTHDNGVPVGEAAQE
jgi:hypothetical protein